MTGQNSADPYALVVFAGHTDVAWLRRLLRPGFRHCFVALNDGVRWLTVDALLHRIEVASPPVPAACDLAGWYRRQGYRVLRLAVPAPPRRALAPMPLTCVEVAKRILGLRAWWIITPWQLFKFIRKNILTTDKKFAT